MKNQFGDDIAGPPTVTAPPAKNSFGDAVVPSSASGAQTPQGDGLAANFAAGFGEGLTGIQDLSNAFPGPGMAVNAVHDLTKGVSDITGGATPVTPQMVTGHDINQFLGKIQPWLDPENVHANTGGERIARAAGAGATAILAPEEAGPSFARAAVNAILGSAAGAGGQGAAELAPPDWKPYAQLAGSAAVALSPTGLKGFVAPQVSAHVQKLLSEGVQLTPGQISGGMGVFGRTAKTVEDAITSIPGVGDIVRSAQRRGLQSFRAAAVNRALDPIGERLPANMQSGRDPIVFAGDRLSAAYDRILPQLRISADAGYQQEVGSIKSSLGSLPKSIRDQFDSIVKDVVGDKFINGRMDGVDFKKAEAELSRLSRKYGGHNATPDQQEMADAIGDLREELHDLVERTNPSLAPTIKAINQGYAVLTRVERAAGSTGAVDGLFTAPQLQNAVRSMDRSSRRRGFARGTALLQDLSDAGRAVMPSSVPDSGTATRALTAAAAIGGGSEFLAHVSPYTLGGMAVAMGLYTPIGVKAAEAFLSRRPYNIQSAAQLFDDLAKSSPAAVATGGVGPFVRQSQPSQ